MMRPATPPPRTWRRFCADASSCLQTVSEALVRGVLACLDAPMRRLRRRRAATPPNRRAPPRGHRRINSEPLPTHFLAAEEQNRVLLARVEALATQQQAQGQAFGAQLAAQLAQLPGALAGAVTRVQLERWRWAPPVAAGQCLGLPRWHRQPVRTNAAWHILSAMRI